MASLEQRNDSYRVVFRFNGHKFSRSLRTKNEKAAIGSLARLEDNLRRLELGTLILPDDVDVASFLLSDGQASGKPKRNNASIRTLRQLCDRFLESVPSGSLEESTMAVMRIHIRHLKRLLGPMRLIREISRGHLQDYVDARSKESGIRGRKVSPTTIKKELATLRLMWNWACDGEHLNRPLPKRGLRYPKIAEKPPFQTWPEIERKIARGGMSDGAQADLWDCLFLTLSEIDEFLQHVRAVARHPFIYPMVIFAAHTGARRSEMIRSRLEDIDLSGDTATIRETKRVRGTLTTRSVPLSPLLKHVLKQWFTDHPGGQHTFSLPLDVIRSGKIRDAFGPLTSDEAHDHFKRTTAGSKWAKLRGWHVFRHSFCSNCAAKGIDQRIINAWVGHQTEEMVRRYRHLIPDQQQAAIRAVFGENVGIRSSALQEAV